MKVLDKILIIFLAGSTWGVLELFGWDALRALNVDRKSYILFTVALIILVATKLILRFPGSLIPVALITIVFKALGVKFFLCQSGAVLIDAAVVDIGYHIVKQENFKRLSIRTLAAPVMAIVAFFSFGIFREFITHAEGFITTGFPGAFSYTINSGLPAALLSIIGINIGYLFGIYAGDKLVSKKTEGRAFGLFQTVGMMVILLIWATLFLR